MAPLVKGPTEGDILKFDLDKNYTREVVTLKSGTNYALGSVLGEVAADGEYTLSPDAVVVGLEGAETAAAVLIEAVDATLADQQGVVISRGPAIVAQGELVFHASVNDDTKRAAKRAQLVALGIIPRVNA